MAARNFVAVFVLLALDLAFRSDSGSTLGDGGKNFRGGFIGALSEFEWGVNTQTVLSKFSESSGIPI